MSAGNEPFSDQQIRNPAEPGHDDVGNVEGPVQGKQHYRKPVSQGDCGEGEGERSGAAAPFIVIGRAPGGNGYRADEIKERAVGGRP